MRGVEEAVSYEVGSSGLTILLFIPTRLSCIQINRKGPSGDLLRLTDVTSELSKDSVFSMLLFSLFQVTSYRETKSIHQYAEYTDRSRRMSTS